MPSRFRGKVLSETESNLHIVINVTAFLQHVAIVSRQGMYGPVAIHLGELLIQDLSSFRMPPASKSTLSMLRTLLKSSTSTKVLACLLEALETAPDTELEALAALLAPLSAQADVKKHCVRCHITYTENKNHSSACQIKHNDEGETDEGITTLNCCGISFNAEYGPAPGFCISARHTTDMDDVLYYESANDDEDNVNTNVISCEAKGCSKKRKAVKKGGNKGGSVGSATKKQKSI